MNKEVTQNKTIIHIEFEIGETVYLITDDEQKERMITHYTVSPHGVTYNLSQGANTSDHYGIEITRGKSYKFN